MRRFTRPVPKQTVVDESTSTAAGSKSDAAKKGERSTRDLAIEIDRQLAGAAARTTTDAAPRAQQTKLKWRPRQKPKPAENEAAPEADSGVRQVKFESPRGKAPKDLARPLADDGVRQADFTEGPDGLPMPDRARLALQQPTDAEELPMEDEPAAEGAQEEPSIQVLDRMLDDDEPRAGPDFERELADRRRAYDEPCPTPSELKPIDQITNNITPQPGEFPRECGLGDSIFEPRAWPLTTFTWKASALCHKPLYFEEMALERYGHSTGPLTQPFVSGAHFFLTLPVLPYLMGVDPPCECIYDLGYYRPGSCAPYMIYPIPISIRGGLLEAGAWVGGVFLIP